MPVAFALDPDARLVRTRAWGLITEDELMSHATSIRELVASGALDEDSAQIADFCEGASLELLSSDAIRRLAEHNPWPVGALRVFIAPSDVIFGLTRMYQLWADLERMHVVWSMAEARTWMTERGRPIDDA